MRTDVEVIIPDEIKDNVTQEEINIALAELEGYERYDIITYMCKYKEHQVFEVSWHNKPRYTGLPLYIVIDKNGKTKLYRDYDAWTEFENEAAKQAPSYFKPSLPPNTHKKAAKNKNK